MKILAIDDSSNNLNMLTAAITEASPAAELYPFKKPSELLTFVKDNPCNIAFLDIHIPDMNGFALAKVLKDMNPKINIIFVTAHSQYASEAFGLYPSGYILKPVTAKDIEREIENLRYPVELKSNARVYVKTFGNFEIFTYGVPLKFRYHKTKELLAYLIDRNGASVSMNELRTVLWEDAADTENLKAYLRKLISELTKKLKEIGADDVLLKQHKYVAVVPEKIVCDSYDFLKGSPARMDEYNGEYMAQYSWAETPMWDFKKIIMQENQ